MSVSFQNSQTGVWISCLLPFIMFVASRGTVLKCSFGHYPALSETFHGSSLPMGSSLSSVAFKTFCALTLPTYLISHISHYFLSRVPSNFHIIEAEQIGSLFFSECSFCFPTVMLCLKVFSLCGTSFHCHLAFPYFLTCPKYCHPCSFWYSCL